MFSVEIIALVKCWKVKTLRAVLVFRCSAGGTAGAIVTCPLEVVKTRLQSSVATFQFQKQAESPTLATHPLVQTCFSSCSHSSSSSAGLNIPPPTSAPRRFVFNMTIYRCLKFVQMINFTNWSTFLTGFCWRYIFETEGPRGLFKGLGPTVFGVAPSRAIYFSTYSSSKSFYNDYLPPNSPLVHICSAGSAGLGDCWGVESNLQLTNDLLCC